jgi:hypothetical protein
MIESVVSPSKSTEVHSQAFTQLKFEDDGILVGGF